MNIYNKNLLGKTIIKGRLICETGIHIGASRENMEIGAIDLSVVRDPVTREPYIPGSALKGKLRSLLERYLYSIEPNIVTKLRNIGTDKNPINIHVCDDASNALNCPLCRIFGSTAGKGEGKTNFPSRLIVRDLYLTQESTEILSDIDTGLQYTEWKFENAIDRVTSAANPRQIERVPRGAEFGVEIIYTVEEPAHIEDDLKNINLALELLQLDALGGHGSRGYGKVRLEYEEIEAMSVDYLKNKTAGQYIKVNSFNEIANLVEIFNGKKPEE